MPTVHFLGKVVPFTGYRIKFWNLPSLKYKSGNTGIEIELSPTVEDSNVDICCTLDKFDKDTLVEMHKIAYDFARTLVNLHCFATGVTLNVIFDEFIDENGVKNPFIIQDLSLAELCTAYSLESGDARPTPLDSVIQIVCQDPQIWLALDEVITAGYKHNSITVNCARAIETLRHAMAPPGSSRGKAWELFRKNLRVGKDYLALITDTSASDRHGEGNFTPGSVTTEIVRRTRTVMNRFLEFRKGNNQPLNEADFPMLDK